MHKQHPVFKELNEDAVLWRYMDLPKYVSMLSKQALFFNRADKFEDPYDGSVNKLSVEQLTHWFLARTESPSHELYKVAREKAQLHVNLNRNRRQATVVNCWHANDDENFAMWKIYTQHSTGLAVKTTWKNLIKSFEETHKDIYIGRVQYYNELNQALNLGNTFVPLISKRIKFSFENEIRCIHEVSQDIYRDYDWSSQEYDNGIYIQCHIATLIEEIYVSPNAGQWFIEVIEEVNGKFGMQAIPVKQSGIMSSEHY